MQSINKSVATRLNSLKRTFASNALEGLDNPKINQYLTNQALKGLTVEESINEIKHQLQFNLKTFLAQFN